MQKSRAARISDSEGIVMLFVLLVWLSARLDCRTLGASIHFLPGNFCGKTANVMDDGIDMQPYFGFHGMGRQELDGFAGPNPANMHYIAMRR